MKAKLNQHYLITALWHVGVTITARFLDISEQKKQER